MLKNSKVIYTTVLNEEKFLVFLSIYMTHELIQFRQKKWTKKIQVCKCNLANTEIIYLYLVFVLFLRRKQGTTQLISTHRPSYLASWTLPLGYWYISTVSDSLLLVEASRIRLQIFSIFVDSCNLKDSFDNARKNISPMHMNLGQKKGDKFPKIWMDRAVHYERVYKAEVRLSTVQ